MEQGANVQAGDRDGRNAARVEARWAEYGLGDLQSKLRGID
jgi:hypothetical protein